MEVVLEKMDSQIYAMNPQIEKVQGAHRMSLVHLGCTHVLLLCTSLEAEIDLMEEDVQNVLKEIGYEIMAGGEINIPSTKIKARVIDRITLQKNQSSIVLPEIAANYSICACRYIKHSDQLHIHLPLRDAFKYQAMVSVEIQYSVIPYKIAVKKGFLGLGGVEEQETDYYKVMIGNEKSNFLSGSIAYTIEGIPYKFPVTEAMRGKEVLIKTLHRKPPQFFTIAKGITLKRLQQE